MAQGTLTSWPELWQRQGNVEPEVATAKVTLDRK